MVPLMNDGWAGKADGRGSARIISPSMANDVVTPPVVGSVSTVIWQQSGIRVTARRRGHLCHLQERKTCPSPRMRAPPEQVNSNDRQTLFRSY